MSLTTFKAMLYTEITMSSFVHAKNGASMGQTQTASTIETSATTPRELMSKHRLTAEEAEQRRFETACERVAQREASRARQMLTA